MQSDPQTMKTTNLLKKNGGDAPLEAFRRKRKEVKSSTYCDYNGLWWLGEQAMIGEKQGKRGSAKSKHSPFMSSQLAASVKGLGPQSRLQRKKLVFFWGSEILTPWLLPCGVLPSCRKTNMSLLSHVELGITTIFINVPLTNVTYNKSCWKLFITYIHWSVWHLQFIKSFSYQFCVHFWFDVSGKC